MRVPFDFKVHLKPSTRTICFSMNDLRCGCISFCGAFVFAAFAAALCQAGEQTGSDYSGRSTASREGEQTGSDHSGRSTASREGDAHFPYPPILSSVKASSSKEDIQIKPRKPRCIYDNGAIRILLEELIVEFFKDLDDMSIELSSNEKHILARRLRGFYHKATKHPAVHERRIAFSSTKPTFQHGPKEPLPRVSTQSLEPLSNEIMSKRNGQNQESCESISYWDIEDHGKLQNETVVELFPKSWLFIRRCVSKESTCNMGNDFLSSYVSRTSCLELTSWVPAFVRQKGYTAYTWDWIQVPSCCSCAIQVPDSH